MGSILPGRRRLPRIEALEPRCLLAGGPLITEFMAVNDHVLKDEDGDYTDWLELHNPTGSELDLAGWYLTDSPARLTRWPLPPVRLGSGQYLVVFASGKDRRQPDALLHANFKLSGRGEFLALVQPDGRTVAHQYAPQYPDQRSDISFGLAADMKTTLYFTEPTPGAANTEGVQGFVQEPTFTVMRGFFDQPFEVQLQAQTPGSEIRYTLDGTPPSATSGAVYDAPIRVARTTTLRAAAFKPGFLASRIVTQTYLFLENVLTQSSPDGYPEMWQNIDGPPQPAYYGVIPEAVDFHRDTILDDLKAVPSLSLALAANDMFGPGGTYNAEGRNVDSATSVELLFPDGRPGFQIDAGLRLQGGWGRNITVPKHPLRLRFTSEFGPAQLEYPLFEGSPVNTFDTLVLRANSQDGWGLGPADQNQLIKDEFARRTQLAMGQPSAHGTWMHLYINGLYWGLYNVVERPDASFAAAYMGGDPDDWDSLNAGQVRNGNLDAWSAMLALTPRGGPDLRNFDEAKVRENYQAIQQYLDVVGFIDYILIGTYLGTADWLPNNYWVGRRSRDGDRPVDPDDAAGRFRFFHWDQEESMLGLDSFKNLPGFASPVGRIFQLLRLSPEFRELEAQRVYDQLFHDGALSPESAAARYQQLVDEVQHAIKGEAIRWGQAPSNVPAWEAEAKELLQTFFPNRREGILNLYRQVGLYPAVDAPEFSQHGGVIRSDQPLAITAAGAGVQIYYTLDGSDPKAADGSIASTARPYTGPITLTRDTVVRTRSRAGNEWSVLNQAGFTMLPHAGDFDGSGQIDARDIDRLCAQIQSRNTDAAFDLNGDGAVNADDRDQLIQRILRTSYGDSNLDGAFDSGDLVKVFQAGQYEDSIAGNSTWATGDWDCDADFTTRDLVLAFQKGGYVAAAHASVDTRAGAVRGSPDPAQLADRRSPGTGNTVRAPDDLQSATRQASHGEPFGRGQEPRAQRVETRAQRGAQRGFATTFTEFGTCAERESRSSDIDASPIDAVFCVEL